MLCQESTIYLTRYTINYIVSSSEQRGSIFQSLQSTCQLRSMEALMLDLMVTYTHAKVAFLHPKENL